MSKLLIILSMLCIFILLANTLHKFGIIDASQYIPGITALVLLFIALFIQNKRKLTIDEKRAYKYLDDANKQA